MKLWREERGAAIIELAIVAPVIALMTVGVVDLSNGFGTKLKIEQAAQRSVEKVMQTTGITDVETTIANEAICQFNGTDAQWHVQDRAADRGQRNGLAHALLQRWRDGGRNP